MSATQSEGTDVAELTEVLAVIFKGVLSLETVAADSDFFELGGDSLLAAEIILDVQERYDVEVDVTALFDEPTPQANDRQPVGSRRAQGAVAAEETPGALTARLPNGLPDWPQPQQGEGPRRHRRDERQWLFQHSWASRVIGGHLAGHVSPNR